LESNDFHALKGQHKNGIELCFALTGQTIFPVIKPKALPWAILSLRFQRDRIALLHLRYLGCY
jgi:hypothetical protein